MSTLIQDLRYALRGWRRAPLFTAGAIFVLALGIGANGAIFSLVRAVLLQPLPYDKPGDVVMVWATYGPDRIAGGTTSTAIKNWRTGHKGVFQDLAALKMWQGNLDAQLDLVLGDRAERLRAGLVTPNFFSVLGVRPEHGRLFTAADEAAGDTNLVVLSHGLWQRAFGGDAGVIGRTITLTAGARASRQPRPFVVVGVLPPAFRFTYPQDTELWTIYRWSEVETAIVGAVEFNGAVARLAPGVTVAQARAVMATVPAHYTEPTPVERRDITGVQLVSDWVSGQVRPSLLLISAVAILLLVIACATIANGLLVRVAERRRELALRLSLGAGRGRLVRQLLAEGFLLATAGTIAGCLLVAILLPMFRSLVPPVVPRADEMSVNVWTLAFASAAAGVVTMLSSLLPAVKGSGVDFAASMKDAAGTASASAGTTRWRKALIAAQAAVATCLLVGATLLLWSFWRLGRVDLGFDASQVVTVEMRLLDPKYFPQRGAPFNYPLAEFQRAMLANVRAIPGVSDASLTTAVPFRGVDFYGVYDTPGCDGAQARPSDCVSRRVGTHMRTVDPAFFGIMRIPLVEGRLFDATDTETTQKVLVVSRQFARRMFGSASAIGQTLEGARIIGVVGDTRYGSRESEVVPSVYSSSAQSPSSLVCLVLRVAPDVVDLGGAIHRAIRAADPAVPAMNLTTIDRILSESVADRRFYTVATSVFAGLALLLTATGLIVVIARSVVERRKEMAIRTAFGAPAAQLIRLTLGQGLAPVVVGACAGLVGAWFAVKVLEQFLFEIQIHDVRFFAAAGVLTVLVGAVACLLPARRITGQSPAAVLRGE